LPEQYDGLGKLTEDLLLLARADADRLRLKFEPLCLEEVVRDVVDLYAPLASDHGVQLDTETPGATRVTGDPAYLRQLLGNLVDNAIKYGAGGERVLVLLTRDNEQACFTVTDNGAGIPAEHLPHIWDRFYRVDAARSGRGPRGSGLGLSICRTIAEAHGGTIDLTSTPAGGTTVTVRFSA